MKFNISSYMSYLLKFKNNSIKNYTASALYVFLILMVWFSKSFALINIGGLYITEIFVTIMLILTGILVYKKEINLRKYYFSKALIALNLYATLRIVISGTVDYNVARHSVLVFYSIFIVLTSIYFSNKNMLKLIISTILVISVMNPIYAVYNVLNHITFEGYRIRAGSDLVAVLSVLIFLVFYSEIKYKKTFSIVCFANLAVLILSIHRSIWLGIISAIVVLFVLLKKINELKLELKKTLLIFVLIIPIILIVVFYALGYDVSILINYLLAKLNVLNEANSSARLLFWEVALKKLSFSPIIGIGYKEPIIVYESIRNIPTTDPHNSILAMLVRNGVLGFALFVWLIISYLKEAIKLIKNNNSIFFKKTCILFVSFLVFMLYYAFFNVVLEGPHDGIFFWIPLGIIAAVKNITSNQLDESEDTLYV